LGTASEVTAYCRKLIDEVKGKVASFWTLEPGPTREEENFTAMIQAAKTYGAY